MKIISDYSENKWKKQLIREDFNDPDTFISAPKCSRWAILHLMMPNADNENGYKLPFAEVHFCIEELVFDSRQRKSW